MQAIKHLAPVSDARLKRAEDVPDYPTPVKEGADQIMPPRNSDEVAAVLEAINVLAMEIRTDRASHKDKTSIPNYIMGVVLGLMVAAGAFVYNTVDRRITDNKSDAVQQSVETATELRVLRTYVIQLTIEMNRRGLQVPPIPETKR